MKKSLKCICKNYNKIKYGIRVACVALLMICITLFVCCIKISRDTPDTYTVTETCGLNLPCNLSVKSEPYKVHAFKNTSKDYTTEIMLMNLIPIKEIQVLKGKDYSIVPCGIPFGVKIFTDGVVIVGIENVKTEDGRTYSPAKDAGLKKGDVIIKINNTSVNSNEDVCKILDENKEKPVKLSVVRNNINFDTTLKAAKSLYDSLYRAGIWIRDSCAGIGTMTFFNKSNNMFAGLGHGICDSDTEELLPLSHGEIVRASINGVVKGNRGAPGELRGSFVGADVIGNLNSNTNTGVYGKLGKGVCNKTESMSVAMKQQIHRGKASVLSTVLGDTPGYYDIDIESVNYNEGTPTKNMIIKITDERLLEITGGIVQGMSGSPIIQDDRLVGAVTHVFVNEPQRGYAIFAENMLKHMDDIYLRETVA